jgi:hypothetical protein
METDYISHNISFLYDEENIQKIECSKVEYGGILKTIVNKKYLSLII